jgi:site-specific DNA-methyltransferase (adenine-specific)
MTGTRGEGELRLYHRDASAEVWCGDSLGGLPGECDAIVTDPPYSERTHAGNDAVEGLRDHGAIQYRSWSSRDADKACCVWSRACRGWIVILTDHVLAPIWAAGLEAAGRYAFAPLPFLSPGSRVRLAGDGPSSWTCWIVVARPKHAPYSKWGTLPGGYVVQPERGMELVGGKPLKLMTQLVEHYSRPGDVVCDPCCGAGTTLRAAVDLGRRAVGIDISAEHCELTKRRLAQQTLLAPRPERTEAQPTGTLFDEEPTR